jgi:hypothetical protein
MQGRPIAVVIAIIAVFQLVFAKTDLGSPTNVIEQYCTHDYNGGRLDATGINQISRLTTFKDEPGWDSIVVSKSFGISSFHINGEVASVMVQYSNYGQLEDTKFNRRQTRETVIFKLKRIKGDWIITSPMIQPHASKDSIIRHLQEIIEEEGNREDIRSVVNTLKALH